MSWLVVISFHQADSSVKVSGAENYYCGTVGIHLSAYKRKTHHIIIQVPTYLSLRAAESGGQGAFALLAQGQIHHFNVNIYISTQSGSGDTPRIWEKQKQHLPFPPTALIFTQLSWRCIVLKSTKKVMNSRVQEQKTKGNLLPF